MAALFVLLGIALGAGAVWLASRPRVDALREAVERERASANEKSALLEEAKHNLQSNFAALSAQALQQKLQVPRQAHRFGPQPLHPRSPQLRRWCSAVAAPWQGCG